MSFKRIRKKGLREQDSTMAENLLQLINWIHHQIQFILYENSRARREFYRVCPINIKTYVNNRNVIQVFVRMNTQDNTEINTFA